MGLGKAKSMTIDMQAAFSVLLPKAITWAEDEAKAAIATGRALSAAEEDLARSVGVARPQLIRISLAETLSMPVDPILQDAAVQTGLLGPNMTGLALGYAVFARRGYHTMRLLSHEFRHVHQYEQAGSIAAFLSTYFREILQFSYANAPLEVDARAHERDTV